MLSAAALALAASGIAFASHARTSAARAAGLGCGLLAEAACIGAFGALRGTIVALVIAMTAASILVLLLPRHPRRVRSVAIASAAAGAAFGVLALVPR